MTATNEWRTPTADLERQLEQLPTDRVVQLRNVDADDVAVTMACATTTLPAAVTHRPSHVTTSPAFVHAVLDDLETVAAELFPAWLPEAENIREPGGAAVAAVRALAVMKAARSQHFGPFFSDLAALALSGARSAMRRYTDEQRTIGLARVIAESFNRSGMILLVRVPEALDAGGERALAAGSEWLADHGRLGVWLAGAPLVGVDWLAGATISAPPRRADQPGGADVIGRPHPRSTTEAALERALAAQEWAGGRVWNQSYQSHALRSPVRLDLLWPAERCVVEVDGPEHCYPRRFEEDRQRDVLLQLDGYAVLRFTNARIRHDVEAVVHQIGKFVQARRREPLEGQPHGHR
jgi:very-short-patch-repair endonuclease